VKYDADERSMIVTSDATAAYRLVNKDVTLVQRTVVFLKPDICAVIDRVRLSRNPLPVQVRFQVDNSDGKGSVSAGADSFTVRRPLVSGRTLVFAAGNVTVRASALDIPADKGVFPFAEVESAASTDHLILTVCEAYAEGEQRPLHHVAREGSLWRITGERGGAAVSVTIDTTTDIPGVTIG
jgi:hypothetical protein